MKSQARFGAIAEARFIRVGAALALFVALALPGVCSILCQLGICPGCDPAAIVKSGCCESKSRHGIEAPNSGCPCCKARIDTQKRHQEPAAAFAAEPVAGLIETVRTNRVPGVYHISDPEPIPDLWISIQLVHVDENGLRAPPC